MAMPRFCGLTGTTSWPSIRMRPLSTAVSPEMQRSRVDLPQPLGPSRVTNSPRSAEKSMSLNTVVLPKLLFSRSTLRKAMLNPCPCSSDWPPR
ncbi:hypothetical protein D3C80_1833250 [compost metagenome]